jgi:hypothetical protein
LFPKASSYSLLIVTRAQAGLEGHVLLCQVQRQATSTNSRANFRTAASNPSGSRPLFADYRGEELAG